MKLSLNGVNVDARSNSLDVEVTNGDNVHITLDDKSVIYVMFINGKWTIIAPETVVVNRKLV